MNTTVSGNVFVFSYKLNHFHIYCTTVQTLEAKLYGTTEKDTDVAAQPGEKSLNIATQEALVIKINI